MRKACCAVCSKSHNMYIIPHYKSAVLLASTVRSLSLKPASLRTERRRGKDNCKAHVMWKLIRKCGDFLFMNRCYQTQGAPDDLTLRSSDCFHKMRRGVAPEGKFSGAPAGI